MGGPGRIFHVPKPYPQSSATMSLRLPAADRRELPSSRSPADFEIHPVTLSKRLRQAAVDDCDLAGVTTTESAELRDAKKRIRLLKQENEVLRRAAAYLGQANLPKADVPARVRARRRRGSPWRSRVEYSASLASPTTAALAGMSPFTWWGFGERAGPPRGEPSA